MKLFVLVLAGAILLFLVIIYIFLSLDRLKSSLTPGKHSLSEKQSARLVKMRKLVVNALLIGVLVTLALILVFISNDVRFKKFFTREDVEKPSRKEKKLQTESPFRDIIDSTQASGIENPYAPSGKKDTGDTDSTTYHDTAGKQTVPLPPDSAIEENTDTVSFDEKATPPEDIVYSGEKIYGVTAKSDVQPQLPVFGTRFLPSTTTFPCLICPPEEETSDPDHAVQTSIPFAQLEGARIGDMFVCAYYDQIEQGRFTKSKTLRFLQPQGKTNQRITVKINLPPLKRKETIQLPFLINGSAIAQKLEGGSLVLNRDGSLLALRSRNRNGLEYSIQRYTKSSEMLVTPRLTEWLQKEFDDIPEQIMGFLKAVEKEPENVKLSTVAYILNTYFGYQTGFRNITFEENSTWNSLLKEMFSTGEKFLCDCDILSTYAFIYLKWLGFNPVLILGYFNLPGAEDSIRTDELHATLYLKSEGEWKIFEPTFFTANFTSSLIREKMTETEPLDIEAYTQGISAEKFNEDYKAIKNLMDRSGIKYFRLPETVMQRLKRTDKSTNNAKLAQLMADLVVEKKEADKQRGEELERISGTPEKMVQFSILIYVLSLFFTKLFLLTRQSDKKIVPFSRGLLFLYSLCIIISLIYIFLRSLGMDFGFWANSLRVSRTAISLSVAAGLMSLISMMVLISMETEEAETSETTTSRIKSRSYCLTGLSFSLAAVIYAPSIITFVATSIIILLFLVDLRKIASS